MHMVNILKLSAFTTAILCGCARSNVVIDGEDLSKEAENAARTSGYESSWLRRDTLRIYTWEDFFAPNVIASFEKALGVKVTLETYDSNEDMFEKLKSGHCNYDIITPSSYIIPDMAKAGLLAKLNHRRLPNIRKNFDRSVAPLLVDPKFTYNVPYTLNYTGLHYDRNRLPSGMGPESFALLGNPALKGRTAIFNDMRELIGAGLMHLGYSINSSSPEEIDAATKLVIEWKRNSGRSDDSFYGEDVRTGKLPVAMCYSYHALMAMQQGNSKSNRTAAVTQEFKLPKSCFSLSVDELVIAANTPHRDLAYAFINYIYETNVARSGMETLCFAMPVKPALDKLNPKMKELLTLSPEKFKRGQVIMGFSERPKAGRLYEDAWKRIQAAK